MAAVRGDDGMMGAEQEQIHNSDDGVTWGGAMVWMAIFFTGLVYESYYSFSHWLVGVVREYELVLY